MLEWSKWFSNTPIVLRLFFAFAWATIIPTSVILILSGTYFNTLRAGGQAVQVSNQAIKITTTELAHLQSMHALLVALLPSITTTATDSHAFQKEQDIILQVLSIEGSFDINAVNYQSQYQLATSSAMADVRAILRDNNSGATLITSQQKLLDMIIYRQWPQYKVAQDNVLLGLKAQISLQEAAGLLQKANVLYTPLLSSWQRIVDIAAQVNSEVVKVGPSQINPILMGTILAVVFTMLIVFGINYFVNRTITRPLHRLATLTKRIMSGETSARADLQGRDEIARVAMSMNTMLDHIVQLVQQTQRQRDILQTQVERLIGETRSVGAGDLTVRAQVTSQYPAIRSQKEESIADTPITSQGGSPVASLQEGAYPAKLSLLGYSFNYMIDQLSGLVVRVKQVARDVENSTGEMRGQMNELVRIGDQQIQEIKQTSMNIEQMAQSSQKVARRAHNLHLLANEAHASVAGGRQAVHQAIDEIDNINVDIQATGKKVQMLGEISEEINNVAEIISSIAYQIQRLALDSAVQAALAGQYGKGFGAVATNIRDLAEQTKNQATIIARLVRSVREDIAATVVSMQNTEYEAARETRATRDIGEALGEIFRAVERQVDGAADINQMMIQQVQSANTIVDIMHYVSDTTQQNTVHMSNAAQLMQHLGQLVEQLRSSVEVFKLREEKRGSSGSLVSSDRLGRVNSRSLRQISSDNLRLSGSRESRQDS